MTFRIRPYDRTVDYHRIDRFLVEMYAPGDTFANWLEPRWEYMHWHPLIVGMPIDDFGVVEEAGRIVGIVHFEHTPAFVYAQVRPGHDHVKPAMVDWAEAHFGGVPRSLGRNVLGMYVSEMDIAFAKILAERGFARLPDRAEPQSRFLLDREIAPRPLPAGFGLHSLDDDNDLAKIDRVLWRGFNHQDPVVYDAAARRWSQGAPHFRKDLTIVVVAPTGDYVAYAGMWVVPDNRVAYVEPVATDPDYRRMGLGTVAVMETLRRAAAEGADVAWVGSDQPFYLAMGFEKRFNCELWLKDLDPV